MRTVKPDSSARVDDISVAFLARLDEERALQRSIQEDFVAIKKIYSASPRLLQKEQALTHASRPPHGVKYQFSRDDEGNTYTRIKYIPKNYYTETEKRVRVRLGELSQAIVEKQGRLSALAQEISDLRLEAALSGILLPEAEEKGRRPRRTMRHLPEGRLRLGCHSQKVPSSKSPRLCCQAHPWETQPL